MHITRSICAAACLFTSVLPTAKAFYPYHPEYHGGDDNERRAQGSIATTRATTHQHQDHRSITLPIRRVPIPNRRENKYTIVKSETPTQKNSAAIDQDGPDFSYMVAVTIGSSKEEYHLLLDSAASNTWVMGQECKSAACASHNTFGDQDSTTLKIDTTPFSIGFGSGSVSGIIATDTLHIASLSPTLSFGLALNVSDEFRSYPMDGILGIGRGDILPGTIEHPQFMDVLSTSKLISSKLYGIHLSRGKDALNDGEFNLGEPNKERYDGDLSFNPTIENDNGYWEIGVVDAGYDGKMAGLSGKSAVLDSGTSYILMPQPDAVALHKLITGYTQSDETFTVPCSTAKPIQIKFGDQTYDISPADYVGSDVGNGNCASNIVGRQVFADTQWLVGDVFFKNVYAVFDSDNSQVGFGVKSGGEEESASTNTITPSGTKTAKPTSDAAGVTSSTADPILPPSESTASSATTQSNTESSQSAKGKAGRATAPASSFALLVALTLLSIFA
ncbi:acid protease [Pleomassaria siparia CBS 279.74]|uniref:Acid protease n=1 Tax=Pleomassaria siparia CBS 279.74 TaxID=1314801 RepID=A0A6G1K987_9PLEO|nr:acid protease [Pleomassaria siparia CBS 279.74]